LSESELFAEIFDRHHTVIRGYLRRRLPRETADELAADVFVIGFKDRERFDFVSPDARPWLFGIASNLVHRHRRTEVRALRAYARTAVDPLAAPRIRSGPETNVIEARLAGALASLKAKDREALFLFACAELTYEEIARALRIPVGTVRSRLSRARLQLRERLGEMDLAQDFVGNEEREDSDERDRFDPIVS